eukprot:122093-Prorocentrum_minimum.AAC.1
MQCDRGVVEDAEGNVISVGGQPLDPERKYRVATATDSLKNPACKPFFEYFQEHPEEKFDSDAA